VLTALLVAVVVYALHGKVRTALDDACREKAVADSRLAGLTTQHEVLNEQLRQAHQSTRDIDAEREQLNTQLQVTMTKHAAAETALADFQAQRASQEGERQTLQQRINQLTADSTAMDTLNQGLREQLGKQEQWIHERTAQFEQTVLAAATKMMEERGKAFTDLNKKEVDAVVAPFKEQLAEFRQRVDHIYAAENKERGELKQQIVQLTSLNQTVSDEARRLTNALTLTSKSTGDWGETILHKILDDSGLREGHEYQLQHSIAGIEGERLQPDVVLFLPGDRQLVVDSKVSNKAWSDYCGETDEARKLEHLQLHLASLRTHLRGLAGKDYARSPDLKTVDFVLMFVPVEGALLTALSADSALYMDAFHSKIILVTPSTLMAVVKLAEGLWTLQRRKESADKIADAGRKLYDKLSVFAGTFVEVGEAINRAQVHLRKPKVSSPPVAATQYASLSSSRKWVLLQRRERSCRLRCWVRTIQIR
jgi:DNA recombination protein RmuC